MVEVNCKGMLQALMRKEDKVTEQKAASETQEIAPELSQFAKKLYKASQQIAYLQDELVKVRKQRDALLQMLQKQMGL